MRKLLLLTLFCFIFQIIDAQKKLPAPVTEQAAAKQVTLEQFKNWKPRNIGPAGMSGRITAIDAVVATPNTIYVGAASGGVWKTENGGQSWNPMFDEQPLQNIGSIAVQQSNLTRPEIG